RASPTAPSPTRSAPPSTRSSTPARPGRRRTSRGPRASRARRAEAPLSLGAELEAADGEVPRRVGEDLARDLLPVPLAHVEAGAGSGLHRIADRALARLLHARERDGHAQRALIGEAAPRPREADGHELAPLGVRLHARPRAFEAQTGHPGRG